MSNLKVWENATQIEEVRKIYGTGLTETEFKIFIQIGKGLNLNPFLKEIWAVKYGTSPAQIFVGRDGYRKNAQKNPEYEYHTADAVYENDFFEITNGYVSHKYNLKDRGRLKGAYCAVKRRHATKEMVTFVEFSEYTTSKSLWNSKPATMIKKVSEAQGLRAAFQELFAGTYDESEEWEEPKYSKEKQIDKLKNVLNIQPSEEKLLSEDDILSDEDSILPNQIEELKEKIVFKKIEETKLKEIFNYLKVKDLAELNQKKYRSLINFLNRN